MKKCMYLMAIVFVGAIAVFTQGAEMGDMALENTLLRQRLDQLDQEIQNLRQSSAMQSSSAGAKSPVWSKVDVEFYGYIKLDMAYDTSRVNTGNFAKWVESERYNDEDDQLNMTANQTRLGFNFIGPMSDGMKTSGKVEVDFYGSGSGENKAGIMMRHAYLKLDWPEKKFNIIAGQTSDVISPLVPTTINYSVAWWAGNIGYRRPQIRLTKELGFENGGSLKMEGALTRNIGRYNASTAVTWDTDSGEDSGVPALQGRASITMPMINGKDATIGLSGHWGEEEYDIDEYGNNKEFSTWSLNLDYSQKLCEKVQLKAEVFKGENLDAYLGGIGQGVTTTGANIYEEVGSKGGWIAASMGPWKNKRFNVGITLDDAERGNVNYETVSAGPGRTLNKSIFGNIICSLNEQTEVGFELSHWRTEYKGPGDSESLRAQLALTYKF